MCIDSDEDQCCRGAPCPLHASTYSVPSRSPHAIVAVPAWDGHVSKTQWFTILVLAAFGGLERFRRAGGRNVLLQWGRLCREHRSARSSPI